MTTLLTAADVATVLSVSARTVQRLAAARLLPRVKVGRSVRFRESDVEHYIDLPSSRSAAQPTNLKPRTPRAANCNRGAAERLSP